MSLTLPLPRGTFWSELSRLFIAHAKRLGYEHPIVELEIDDGVLFEADGSEDPQPERVDMTSVPPLSLAELDAMSLARVFHRVAPAAPPQPMRWSQLVSRSVVRDTIDELTPCAPLGSELTAFWDFIAMLLEDEIARRAARRVLAIATAQMLPAAEARRRLRAREASAGATG